MTQEQLRNECCERRCHRGKWNSPRDNYVVGGGVNAQIILQILNSDAQAKLAGLL